MRVLLIGAGRLAINVAINLRDAGHHVTIVDTDANRAKIAFERHGLVALVGDATDAMILRDAEIERADVVLAMLSRDADSLAVAVQARAAGVKRVLVRMRDPSYAPFFERVGVERVLSETDVVIGVFATAIEHDAVHHVMPLGAGHSIAFELRVPQDAKVAGVALAELAQRADFPDSCVVAALYGNDGSVEPARGTSVVRGGHTVLLVARKAQMGEVIEFFSSPGQPE